MASERARPRATLIDPPGYARHRPEATLLCQLVERVERLDLTAQGQVRYRLKTPYRDGTTHIVRAAGARALQR